MTDARESTDATDGTVADGAGETADASERTDANETGDVEAADTATDEDATTAARVRLSYPSDLSDWGRDTVSGEPFAAYLRRVHDEVAVGDVWAEFVGVGCCGDTRDVPLRVEAVASDAGADVDAATVDESTEFAFEERTDADGGGGWTVQSRAGR